MKWFNYDFPPLKAGWWGGSGAAYWKKSYKQLGLQHEPVTAFSRCRWQTRPGHSDIYLVYRWLLLVCLMSVCIASFVLQKNHYPPDHPYPKVEVSPAKWFIYLTHWGLVVYAVQAALAVAVQHASRAGKLEPPERTSTISTRTTEEGVSRRRGGTPLLCRVYWAANTCAVDLAFVISLIYWALVYNPSADRLDAINIISHCCNSIVMLIEISVTSHPVRLCHALYPALLGLLYGVFSAIYQVAGGTNQKGEPAIYRQLDWRVPGKTVLFVCMCMVVSCVMQTLHLLLSRLRDRIAEKYIDKNTSAHPVKLTAIVTAQESP